MASQTMACFPGLFQPKFSFQYRRSNASILVTRVTKLDRRIQVHSMPREGVWSQNGNGFEHRYNSWLSINSSTESVAGWSNSNDDGPSLVYERNQWLKEIMGKTIAGVVLFVGLSFATLSLRIWPTSRPKQQMEHLTPQEEASISPPESLCNDSPEMGVEYDGRESNISINTDSISLELGNSSLEQDDSVNAIRSSDCAEAISDNSSQKDLQHKLGCDDLSFALDTSPDSCKLSQYEVVNDSSRFIDLDPNTASRECIVSMDANDSPSLFIDSEVAILQQDRVAGSMNGEPKELSETELYSTSGFVDCNPDEEKSMLEPNIPDKDEMKPLMHDYELENTPDVLAEDTIITLETSSMRESVYYDTTDAAAHVGGNEQTTNNKDKIGRSKKFHNELNSSAGFPAPSLVSAASLQAHPGKVLVPAAVDHTQCQALSALQVLKVIESDVKPSDLCTRREYARWLVSASSVLSRSTVSKVYPAMYIENVTELAFDDITHEDPDFSYIQGLAEAGLISSKFSRRDMFQSLPEDEDFDFSPESPLSRQDLVSWKLALEKRLLPEADRKTLHQLSGFLDIDKINPDAWPAVMADVSAGDHGITVLAFGYTKLFQPNKPVTKAQAAIALSTGEASEIVSEELARMEAESIAENAIDAHNALVAQVEKDVNAVFEKQLSLEREKISAVEKLAEEARRELGRLKAQRDEEDMALMKERAAVESEMEVLGKLRREVEGELESVLMNKVELGYEKERAVKLRNEAESGNIEIARLHYELDVERKALSMARVWAEEEARKAREEAKALEEARVRWQKHGIKVMVDSDLREEEASTWINAGKQIPIEEESIVSRGENLVENLKTMAAKVGSESKRTIDFIIQRILHLISRFRDWTSKSLPNDAILRVKKVAEDCREGVEKLTHKFKM